MIMLGSISEQVSGSGSGFRIGVTKELKVILFNFLLNVEGGEENGGGAGEAVGGRGEEGEP